MSTTAQRWAQTHTFSHREFPADWLSAADRPTVSICLPARNEARTIGRILCALEPLRDRGLVAQIVVVDHSTDGTGEIARRLGAEVHDQADLMPELGPVLGKGDAMWRAQSVLEGEIICFLDADSEDLGPHFPCGLIGPLVRDPSLAFVKGFYRRPFRLGDHVDPEGGGRVTELTARPLLALFYPELAAVRQPLAGEIAERRGLLEQLPFVTGYGVDIALLLDAHGAVGLPGMAQVDLDVRQNDHQPLKDLGPMADAVLGAVASRLVRDGRLIDAPGPADLAVRTGASAAGAGPASAAVERPPLVQLRAAA
jgi:glucosyl-3-phosphoglycerate synthase